MYQDKNILEKLEQAEALLALLDSTEVSITRSMSHLSNLQPRNLIRFTDLFKGTEVPKLVKERLKLKKEDFKKQTIVIFDVLITVTEYFKEFVNFNNGLINHLFRDTKELVVSKVTHTLINNFSDHIAYLVEREVCFDYLKQTNTLLLLREYIDCIGSLIVKLKSLLVVATINKAYK